MAIKSLELGFGGKEFLGLMRGGQPLHSQIYRVAIVCFGGEQTRTTPQLQKSVYSRVCLPEGVINDRESINTALPSLFVTLPFDVHLRFVGEDVGNILSCNILCGTGDSECL